MSRSCLLAAFAFTRFRPGGHGMPRLVPTSTLLFVVLGMGAQGSAHAQSKAVSEIQVAPPSLSLTAGQRSSVFATAYDAGNNVVVIQKITWVSLNPAVVRVESDSTSPDV